MIILKMLGMVTHCEFGSMANKDRKRCRMKPCPFCGGEADFERYDLSSGSGIAVKCSVCKAQVFRNTNAGGMNAALEAWDRRTER